MERCKINEREINYIRRYNKKRILWHGAISFLIAFTCFSYAKLSIIKNPFVDLTSAILNLIGSLCAFVFLKALYFLLFKKPKTLALDEAQIQMLNLGSSQYITKQKSLSTTKTNVLANSGEASSVLSSIPRIKSMGSVPMTPKPNTPNVILETSSSTKTFSPISPNQYTFLLANNSPSSELKYRAATPYSPLNSIPESLDSPNKLEIGGIKKYEPAKRTPIKKVESEITDEFSTKEYNQKVELTIKVLDNKEWSLEMLRINMMNWICEKIFQRIKKTKERFGIDLNTIDFKRRLLNEEQKQQKLYVSSSASTTSTTSNLFGSNTNTGSLFGSSSLFGNSPFTSSPNSSSIADNKTPSAAPTNSNNNDEKMLYEFLCYFDMENCHSPSYIYQRIEDLSRFNDMRRFLDTWNSGGDVKSKGWNFDYPTDSEIVMHCFCTFFDRIERMGGFHKSPFTSRFFRFYDQKPARNVFIWQKQKHFPHYEVWDNELQYAIGKGPYNLIDCLIVFCALIYQKHHGLIDPPSINIADYKLMVMFSKNKK